MGPHRKPIRYKNSSGRTRNCLPASTYATTQEGDSVFQGARTPPPQPSWAQLRGSYPGMLEEGYKKLQRYQRVERVLDQRQRTESGVAILEA